MKRWQIWTVIAAVGLAGLGLSSVAAWLNGDWLGLFLNLGTELVGAVAIYVLLDRFVSQREGQEAEKARLIEELGSSVADVAMAAAEKLRTRGWLADGSCQGASLDEADLRGADLPGADLCRAYLIEAELCGADLRGADLRGANLYAADLSEASLSGANLSEASLREADLPRADLCRALLCGADLTHADLRSAYLIEADLRGADLTHADLSEADLSKADLRGADLTGANIDVDTILPDGTKWTPDTDMGRFTDPAHLDYAVGR